MGKILVIAEKPSVAGDIAKALGGFDKANGWFERADVVVSSAVGHLVEIEVPEGEDPGYKLDQLPVIPSKFSLAPISRSADQLRLLGKLLKRPDIDCVVNACDAGREGELIFRYIYRYHQCAKRMKRLWLQSMTADAIRDAWKKLEDGVAYDALYDAAVCRSEADWIIGVNATRPASIMREMQTGERSNTSVGRVQTPTLALIVDRENEIKIFVPREYFEIHGTFAVAAGQYVGRWNDPEFKKGDDETARSDRLFDRTMAQKVIDRCRNRPPSAVKDETKPASRSPFKLFDLTSLQREANNKFGFSAKMTLDLAQVLYEKHKVLTYPRTDSSHLPSDYVETVKATIGKFSSHAEYGQHATRVLTNQWVKPVKTIFDDSKITDHFAIIPNGAQPDGLDQNEQKIFDLVMRRFLAAFHPAAEYLMTTRTTWIDKDIFLSAGRVLTKEGWLAVYGMDADDDETPTLPKLDASELPENIEIALAQLKTKPPARFTEATLLGAMENAGKKVDDDELREAMKERGLGTPATRAAIIEKLLSKDRSYIKREKKMLVPTDKGQELIMLLRSLGLDTLTQPELTGEWEFRLRQMEKGAYARTAFMAEICTLARDIVEKIRAKAAMAPRAAAMMLDAPCPKCHGKLGMNGRAWECACGFKLWTEVAGRKISGPEANTLLKHGRTDVLSGFLSTKRKPFSARLKLSPEGKVEFEFQTAAEGTKLDAKCPKCSGTVGETDKFFGCTKCDYRLSRVIAQRTLSATEVGTLLSRGVVGPLKGFVSKSGSKFEASLKLDDDKRATFVFAERPAGAGMVGEEISGKCPQCQAPVAETPKAFGCTKCDFRIWKEVAGKALSKKHVMALLKNGTTEVIKGFKGKTSGKPFDARLKLEAGKVRFAFD